MTVREIRAFLVALENQKMTVEKLRSHLFDVSQQDTEITAQTLAEIINSSHCPENG